MNNKFPKATLILKLMKVRGVTYNQLGELCKKPSNKTARNLYAKIRGDRKLTVEDGVDIMKALDAPDRDLNKFTNEWRAKMDHIALKRLDPSPEAIERFSKDN